MDQGPEYRMGWRDSFEVGGVRVELHARHYTRRRMPRGHEMARQAARGLPLTLVEETDHEWSLICAGRHAGTIRRTPGGTWELGHRFYRGSLREAVAEMVRDR